MSFSSSLDQFNQHIFSLSLQFSSESQIGSMKYLSLFVKVAPLICKWLIVEFDNVGGSLKGSLFT